MSATTRLLLLAALPALVAGWLVFFIAQVEIGVWASQAVAMLLMISFMYLGDSLPGGIGKNRWVPLVCVVGAATLCSLPLLFSGTGPKRWVNFGPVRFYVSAIVLPLVLAVAGHFFRLKSKDGTAAMTAIALILTLQPDFSQVLAFSIGLLLILFNSPMSAIARLVLVAMFATACAVTYAQPDPLKPVPYVEGVFELAFRHSMASGVVVLLCAAAFLGLLARGLQASNHGFLGIPAYYAVLFGCSVAGLTPAPLIGFGAGPVLGFGLLVAGVTALSRKGIQQVEAIQRREMAGERLSNRSAITSRSLPSGAARKSFKS